MTKKELAKSLLELDLSRTQSPTNPQEITRQVLDKDRRRVRIVAWLTAVCWLGSAGALYWLIFSLTGKYADMMKGGQEQTDPVVVDLMSYVFILASSVEGLIFAVLCTLVLLFYSRRATLRQVNSNLVEISSQLKHLTEMPGE